VFAQLPLAKVRSIGFLGAESASVYVTRLEALRAGLLELGYVENGNYVLRFRWAEGKYDRLPDLAAELVSLRVDVIVADGLKATLAAKRASATTPIVAGNVGDAVQAGLIASYAKPGGNVTGMSFLAPELTSKRLQLLKQAKPRITKVAVLINPANPVFALILQVLRSEAERNMVQIEPIEVREADELESAFSTPKGSRPSPPSIELLR
jgi:putative ABC transport system substrate-binding protein